MNTAGYYYTVYWYIGGIYTMQGVIIIMDIFIREQMPISRLSVRWLHVQTILKS